MFVYRYEKRKKAGSSFNRGPSHGGGGGGSSGPSSGRARDSPKAHTPKGLGPGSDGGGGSPVLPSPREGPGGLGTARRGRSVDRAGSGGFEERSPASY